MNNLIRNITVFGTSFVLIFGIAFNYFYAYKIKQDDDLIWFVAMLTYSLVMFIQQFYIFYQEVIMYESKFKSHACYGAILFFLISVISVIAGFTLFSYGLIWIILIVLIFPILLYLIKLTLLKK